MATYVTTGRWLFMNGIDVLHSMYMYMTCTDMGIAWLGTDEVISYLGPSIFTENVFLTTPFAELNKQILAALKNTDCYLLAS